MSRKKPRRNRKRRKNIKPLQPAHTPPAKPNPPQEHNPEKSLIQAENFESSFSGPLPPPEFFEKYDKVLPGAADRILTMAESEQQQRHTATNSMINGEQAYRKLGLIGAFAVVLLFIAGAIYLVSIDKNWQGLGLLAVSVYGLLRGGANQQRRKDNE